MLTKKEICCSASTNLSFKPPVFLAIGIDPYLIAIICTNGIQIQTLEPKSIELLYRFLI